MGQLENAAPKKTSESKGEVTMLIKDINHMVSITAENIFALEEKLESVRRSEPQNSDAEPGHPIMQTEAGNNLIQAYDSLRILNARLVSLREQVEL